MLKLVVLALVGALALYGIYTYFSVRGFLEGGPAEAFELQDVDCESSRLSGTHLIFHLVLVVDYKSSLRATLKGLDVDILVDGYDIGWANLTEDVPLRRGVIKVPFNVTLVIPRLAHLIFELVNSSLSPEVDIVGVAVVHHPIIGDIHLDVDYSRIVDLSDYLSIDLSNRPMVIDDIKVLGVGIEDVHVEGSDIFVEATVFYDGSVSVQGSLNARIGAVPLGTVELAENEASMRFHVPSLLVAIEDLLDDYEITIHFSGNLTVNGEEHRIDDDRYYSVDEDFLCNLIERSLQS